MAGSDTLGFAPFMLAGLDGLQRNPHTYCSLADIRGVELPVIARFVQYCPANAQTPIRRLNDLDVGRSAPFHLVHRS